MSGASVRSLTSKPYPSTAQEIHIKTVLKASKWLLLLSQEPELHANLMAITKFRIKDAENIVKWF